MRRGPFVTRLALITLSLALAAPVAAQPRRGPNRPAPDASQPRRGPAPAPAPDASQPRRGPTPAPSPAPSAPSSAPTASPAAPAAAASAAPAASAASGELAAPSEVDVFAAGKRPLRRGSIAAQGSAKISISGKRTSTVGQVASVALGSHDAFTQEARRGRAALAGDPVVTDEVVELTDSTILTRTTKLSVTDPVALRAASPTFARMRSGKAGTMKVTDLRAGQRAGFETFKQEVATYPAEHPLRTAAAQSDQALLDAIGSGLGDFAVTTTLVIPKHAPARDASGNVLKPVQQANGVFEMPRGGGTSVRRGPQKATGVTLAQPTVTESGTCDHTMKFLAGFTEGDSWGWSTRFDLPGGYFRLGASAWYDYGLRIPIQIKATQAPNRITTDGERDVARTYDVTMTADVLDASSSFYSDTGLPQSEVHDGKELVLDAGFAVTLTLKIFGEKLLDETIPGNSSFDFGQHFRPPFGDCGTSCGLDIWIPADVTRTNIDLLVVKGSARAGVKVTGDGEVSLDFEALSAGRAIDSWAHGKDQETARKHAVTFLKTTGDRKRTASLAPLGKTGDQTPYGYRLSNPGYTWDIELIPGIRGDIEITVWPFKDTITIGPFWLTGLGLDLGTLRLGPHAGTQTTIEQVHGEKKWQINMSDASIAKLPGATSAITDKRVETSGKGGVAASEKGAERAPRDNAGEGESGKKRRGDGEQREGRSGEQERGAGKRRR